MKFQAINILVFFLFFLNVKGQDAGGLFTLDVEDLYIAADVETFDLRKKELEYNNRITEDWMQADLITLNDSVVDKYLIKYDPLTKNIFLKEGSQVFVVPPTYFKAFVLKGEDGNKRFDKFKFDNQPQEFFELLKSGKYSLYKRFKTEFQKSNYNPLLDAGNYNDKVVLKETFCFFHNNTIETIPSKKKKAEAFFIKKKRSTARFIKKEKLNLKKESDLFKIFNFLNKK